MNHLFTTLQTIDFGVQFYGLSNPKSIHSLMSVHPAILMLRAAYKQGKITAIEIEDWVDRLLEDLKDQTFIWTDALSSIAVALEPCEDEFAAEYINDLAALEMSELWGPRYIAKICQENRSQFHMFAPSPTSSERAVS